MLNIELQFHNRNLVINNNYTYFVCFISLVISISIFMPAGNAGSRASSPAIDNNGLGTYRFTARLPTLDKLLKCQGKVIKIYQLLKVISSSMLQEWTRITDQRAHKFSRCRLRLDYSPYALKMAAIFFPSHTTKRSLVWLDAFTLPLIVRVKTSQYQTWRNKTLTHHDLGMNYN